MKERGYWSRILEGRVSRRRILLGASSITGAAALLAACGGDNNEEGGTGSGPQAASGQPKSGGIVRMDTLTPNDPAHFDLHQAPDANISWIVSMYYNQLLRFSEEETDRIDPDLAASWETSPDGLTYTFKLREASFHDGTPFTSRDVKATIERVKNPPQGVVSIRQQQFASLNKIETPDDRTVVFQMAQPSASFLGVLAQINIGIYAAKDMADPNFHRKNVNGTGPFMPDRIDQGSRYTAKKNPNYFMKGQPYVDGWEWFIIPEDVARFAAFTAGNLDITNLNIVNIPDVERMSNATLLKTAGTAFWRITVATYKDPWKDERTWKAISLAVSRQDFNQAAYQGQSLIGAMGVPPGSKWSLTEEELLKVPGYAGLGDGKKASMEARWAEAKKLLSAAGIENGRSVDVFGREGTATFQTHAEVVADGLRNVGLNPKINLYERGTYDQRLGAGDFGDVAANSGSAVFPDPTPVYADTYLRGAARNYQKVVVPEADDLWAKQERELDPARRVAIQKDMQKAYLAKYPLATHVFTTTIQAFYKYVKDFGVLYGSFYQGRKYDKLWLDK